MTKRLTRPHKKRGRKAIDLDARAVKAMATHGCSTVEIAQALGCSVDTVDRKFADLLSKSRMNRRERLRAKQTSMALKGNVPLLIFLGKNELGQTDKTDITSGGKSLATLVLASMQPEPPKVE